MKVMDVKKTNMQNQRPRVMGARFVLVGSLALMLLFAPVSAHSGRRRVVCSQDQGRRFGSFGF